MRMILAMTISMLAINALATEALSDREAAMVVKWKKMVLDPKAITQHTDGEEIGWKGSPFLRGMVKMAEATGDRECLDAFCKAFEHLMSIASTDIDGLFGWPTTQGSYGKAGKRCIIMDDGLICEPVAKFAKIVNADAELKKTYGERATKYLAFVEEKILPKWADSWLELKDNAETYIHDGKAWARGKVPLPEVSGVYRFVSPGKKPGMSLPLNQFWHVAKWYLALYDATKKEEYLDKVTKMARTGKYVYLEQLEDRVRPWCYWRPVCASDFKEDGSPVSWVGAHPERSSYASFEASMMAEFHKRKIVFTDEDIKRVVKLNLHQWNKDEAAPKFDYPYDRRPGYTKPYPSALWSAFAEFDPTIEKLSSKSRTLDSVEAVADKWGGIEAVPNFLLRKKQVTAAVTK